MLNSNYFKSLVVGSLLLISPSMASQNMNFDTKFLFEGMDYTKLYDQSRVLSDPTFAPSLEKEGLMKHIEQKTLSSVLIDNSEEEKIIDMSMALLEEVDTHSNILEPLLEGVLTSNDLDTALTADFRKSKKRAMLKTILRPMFLMTGELSVFGGGIAALNAAAPGTMSFAIGIAGFVLLEVFSRNMSLCFNTIWYLFITPIGDPLTGLEDVYAAKKRFFPTQLQLKIERGFQDARKDDQTGSKKDYLDKVLKLPVKSKKPKFDIRALQKACAGFKDRDGKDVAELIMVAIVNHMARYTEKAGPNPSPNMILYLQGPPGLGKTNLVQGLARLMGLSLIALQVSDEHFKSTSSAPGSLFQGITSKAERNCVLYLNEFDRVANEEGSKHLNTLLPFVDPSALYLRDDFVGEEFDISHYFRIGDGNHELKDKALLDRCIVVNVEQLDSDMRLDGIHNKMLPLLMRSEDQRLNLDLSKISQSTVDLIERALNEDKGVGFREIQKTLQIILNKERLGKLE
ncbi:MAG: AAA family ATPase [Alphaproteobacteria bacterium]|nr:AAA family ATPase [Alphaproteobacteria bacterium]